MSVKRNKGLSSKEAIRHLKTEIEKLEIKKAAADDLETKIRHQRRIRTLKRNLEMISGKIRPAFRGVEYR